MDIVLWIIVGIVLLAVLWYISVLNQFRRLIVKIDESESGIDVALERRYDTLQKLLEVCRQYAAHETETFAKVIELRRGMPMAQRREAAAQMDTLAGQVNVLAEAYPELRSAEVFQELEKGVREVEVDLQASRRFYNANVSSFNQLLVMFPSNMVGRQQGHTAREFFETQEKKRADVDMKL